MTGCFVYGCKSGYHGSGAHLFKIPRLCSDTIRQKWVSTLRKVRTDKKYDPNNPNHRICHQHFEEKYIINSDVIKIGSDINVLPKRNWTLAADAVPTIFPSIPRNPVKLSPQKRKAPDQRLSKKVKVAKIYIPPQTQSSLGEFCGNGQSHPDANASPVDSVNPQQFRTLTDLSMAWNILSPEFEKWNMKTITTNYSELCFLYLLKFGTGPTKVQVEVQVSSNLTVTKIFVEQQQVPLELYHTPDQIFTELDLRLFLLSVQKLRKCEGLSGYESVTRHSSATKQNGNWFSATCVRIGEHCVCIPCKLLAQSLERIHIQQRHRVQIPTIRNLKKQNDHHRKQAIKLRRKNNKIRIELLKLRSSFQQLNVDSLNQRLEHLKIDHGTRLTIGEAVRCAKAKSSRGIRYSTEWLLESMLLKIKSPAAYKHLRDCSILPLPHPSTIKRLISGSPCEFGFNKIGLDAIHEQFKSKIRRDRQGVLVFDEMKLRKTLDFNKGTLKFDGYVNYGDYTSELSSGNEFADHALVFAYRPYNDSWVQPVAVFATKGAAKGAALEKLLVECIIRLEAVGAEVLCTVSDGATTNKNLWKKMGISGLKQKVVNKIVHPCDETRYLYFGSDVPHILKCIRNHFEKHRIREFDGDSISYEFYADLFRVDNQNTAGLRKCPKLTKAHIWPNSFEKMRVNYAAQLFSQSVESGLKFYRELGVESMKASEGTERFTSAINNLFDILNSRLPKDGLTLVSPKIETLKMFNEMLNSNSKNTFASPQTLESLRVTIKTTLEIAEYLSKELGFSYILTAKLNQDCLERYFGLIRAAGGREEHPTVSNFVQLYRLLSMYTPIKRVVRGNITSSEKLAVLVSFADGLKRDSADAKERRSQNRSLWEAELAKKIMSTRSSYLNFAEPHSLTLAEQNLVYHLCGFLVKKAAKLFKCTECVSTLRSNSSHPSQALLTEILDRGSGKLFYPSRAFFFFMLSNIEPVVSTALDSSELYGDILLRIIEKLSDLDCRLIGCEESEHGPKLLCQIIPYYIMMRFHFYSKAVKQDFLKLARSKRKIYKLQSS